jgi:16S rRNA (uracil1498-N3)-methyltransferase
LQKAVELGVDEITPLWTQHVAYKWDKAIDAKKMAQWQGIIIAACEQSGRTRLPILHPITPYQDFVKQQDLGSRWILDPGASCRWKDLSSSSSETKVTVMIGPEGGFSGQEYQMAAEGGFKQLSLGPRILRTETAVVSILSILQALYGDL